MGQGKPSLMDQKMKVKEWQWQLKQEEKQLNKETEKLRKAEVKIQEQIRAKAEVNDIQAVQGLAEQVVRTRTAIQRLEKTKIQMHGLSLQLDTTAASMSTTANINLSADIMSKMNAIAGVPEVAKSMERMRAEMAKSADAEATINSAIKVDGEEVAAAAEVQKVLDDMALDHMGPVQLARQMLGPQAEIPKAEEPAEEKKQAILAEGEEEEEKEKPPVQKKAPVIEPPKKKEKEEEESAPTPAPAPAPAGPSAAEEEEMAAMMMLQSAKAVSDAPAPPAAPPAAARQAPVLPPPAPNAPNDDELWQRLQKLRGM